jgi:hypothetical protein
MMRFSWLLVLGSWFFFQNGYSQFYESGHEPASIRWQQINTPHVKLIFPSGFDSAATRLATMFDYIYRCDTKSLNSYPRKISVILHNHSCYSNGFVTLAPRRMELFTTPPQVFTAQDWMTELAIHEYRHVVQTGKVNQGVTRMLYPFFGQISSGLVAAALPMWFVEGDAVYAETMLTSSGRGRTGSFVMETNALLGERKNLFSFEKALYGSYNDYVPDHYHWGYFMVSSIRSTYGAELFDKSIQFTARNPFIPFSFSQSLKKQTGKNARTLYSNLFTTLKREVTDSLRNRADYPSFGQDPSRSFTSYNYPQVVNDTTILTVCSGLDDIRKFIFQYQSGREQTIYTPGYYSNTRFSYAQGKLAWSEEIPDLRWSNRSFCCIKIWDSRHQTLRRLTHKSRYFAAALSCDASKVATVEITLKNEIFLVILDASTGKVLVRAPAPGNLLLSDPVYTANGQSVIVVANGDAGKAIYRYTFASNSWEPLTGFSFYNLSCPSENNGCLLFSSDFTGTNNLYAYRYADKSFFRLTNAKNGAFEPFYRPKDSVLFFSDYSSQGYKVKFLKTSAVHWVKYHLPGVYSDSLIHAGTKIEDFNFQDSILTNRSLVSGNYVVKPYSKLAHIFNIHSWSPFYFDYNNLSLDNQTVNPGITLLSQDKLSSCISSVSYYNSDGTWLLKPRFIYKGWWPVIDLSVDYGGNVPYYRQSKKTAPPQNGYVEATSSIYVPLNLTRGKYLSALTPSVQLNYDNSRLYTSDSSYRNGRLFALFGINYYSYLKTSDRDIAPKLGFSVTTRYKYAPFDKVLYGYIAYIKPRIYLPGLFPHHSLQVAAAYQVQNPVPYLYSSSISIARGYSTSNVPTYHLYTLSGDYAFPLFYPDWNIGPLAYFKRFRANLFCDFAQNQYKYYQRINGIVTSNWVSDKYWSMGTDFITDFYALHIYFPFSAGVRTIYMPYEGSILTEFIMEVHFNF